VEAAIRQIVPRNELAEILDNIGLPYSGLNVAYSDTATVGPFDGEILVSLKPGEHRSTWDYVREMRRRLPRQFPNLSFFFQPADIVSQILNFGLPAPIDVQVIGPNGNQAKNLAIARQMEARLRHIPGAVDVHLHQVTDAPEFRFEVDRTRAAEVGLTQRDVANNMLVTLASSTQVSPNFWINPQTNVDYPVAVQTPIYRVDSTAALLRMPLRGTAAGGTQMLSNVGRLTRSATPSIVNHYNAQGLFDVLANVQDRDLGAVAGDVDKVIAEFSPKLPRGSFIETRGQVRTMRASFFGLSVGLGFAIVLVYFLMVVNFQSWLDPFIILMALPGALAGIALMLFVTQTTINVPSLMGAIMCIGVATANSILMVVFANDEQLAGLDARQAALSAGYTRIRPVIMTALAMVIGMIPMALGLGEGGEQNAPLARSVIGGLAVATATTLFVVPIVYSLLRKRKPVDYDQQIFFEEHEGEIPEASAS
jgi:multidrug efflux pump subunit AcrB